mmetsp:Transcript_15246/g.18498  ORF Transcript_15246/g.18498 Transcript_15246/m.18498 type:complete len:507 (-) Transcript_15246:1399-2919(-)|eukprot:CAMPEP_0184031878 /NCGR_PEP_ID=MMETSP0955-20130417/2585_1 /TAXON_ID=627963 /ORGANISM="Aplanochytrium sp, Strain PBS07" /LENGTH=506 /DNA_ID=CAMNT_0026317749 /DNA_START=108 /DNA_END=1628 /DNA_ORIENTATION=+
MTDRNEIERAARASSLKTLKRRAESRYGKTSRRSVKALTGKNENTDEHKPSLVEQTFKEYGYELHECGYYSAAQDMCKLITPSNQAIQIAGGFILSKCGEIKVRKEATRNGSGASKPKRRYMVLRQGKLRFYNTVAPTQSLMPDEPDEEFLYEKETIFCQYIRAIRVKSLKAKSFQVVVWKRKSDESLTRTTSRLSLTLRRGQKKDDMNLKVRNSNSKKSKGFALKKSASGTNVKKGLRDSGSSDGEKTRFDSASSSGSMGSVFSRFSSKNLGLRASASSADTWDSEEEDDRDLKEEVVTIRCESSEQMKEWVRNLLIEIENQAIVFDAYADILGNDAEKASETEDLRRHAVDLWTLAKGIDNQNTWGARERLAEFLQSVNKLDEANMWFELSHSSKTMSESKNGNTIAGIHRIPKREESFYQLTEFVKRNAKHITDPDEQSRKWCEEFTHSEIAVKLFRQYKKVPVGWEYYLINSKGNTLEVLQKETESVKERLGRGTRDIDRMI